jgi:hypothetical protein
MFWAAVLSIALVPPNDPGPGFESLDLKENSGGAISWKLKAQKFATATTGTYPTISHDWWKPFPLPSTNQAPFNLQAPIVKVRVLTLPDVATVSMPNATSLGSDPDGVGIGPSNWQFSGVTATTQMVDVDSPQELTLLWNAAGLPNDQMSETKLSVLVTYRVSYQVNRYYYVLNNEKYFMNYRYGTWPNIPPTNATQLTSNVMYYHAEIRKIPFRILKTMLSTVQSFDQRITFGSPDQEGKLVFDPNVAPGYVTFNPWVYKGGLFSGVSGGSDKSGRAVIRLTAPAATAVGGFDLAHRSVSLYCYKKPNQAMYHPALPMLAYGGSWDIQQGPPNGATILDSVSVDAIGQTYSWNLQKAAPTAGIGLGGAGFTLYPQPGALSWRYFISNWFLSDPGIPQSEKAARSEPKVLTGWRGSVSGSVNPNDVRQYLRVQPEPDEYQPEGWVPVTPIWDRPELP